jgi:hypothetical protein
VFYLERDFVSKGRSALGTEGSTMFSYFQKESTFLDGDVIQGQHTEDRGRALYSKKCHPYSAGIDEHTSLVCPYVTLC